MRRADIWLVDIKTEIDGIRELTKRTTFEEFEKSWAMKRAVQHALLIIAEAAKHVPQDLKMQAAEVPWQRIHGWVTCCDMNIATSTLRSCGQ